MRRAAAGLVVAVLGCRPATGEVAATPAPQGTAVPPSAQASEPAWPAPVPKEEVDPFPDTTSEREPATTNPSTSPSPGDPSSDDQLFEAGHRAMSQGDTEAGHEYFLELIREHPTSPHVPAVFLAFGDEFFDRGQMPEAQQFYEKVLQFPGASVAPFAKYKLAWVHTNRGDGPEALQQLVGVIADGAAPEALRAQARKDLPRFYAEVGQPTKARAAFRQWIGDPAEVERAVQSLAGIYGEQGKLEARAALLASK